VQGFLPPCSRWCILIASPRTWAAASRDGIYLPPRASSAMPRPAFPLLLLNLRHRITIDEI
jgi:hypothetical protein